MIYMLHSENLYTFQNANTTLNIFKTVAKKLARKSFSTVEHFHSDRKSHITKQFGRHKDLSTLKSDIHLASVNINFSGR